MEQIYKTIKEKLEGFIYVLIFTHKIDQSCQLSSPSLPFCLFLINYPVSFGRDTLQKSTVANTDVMLPFFVHALLSMRFVLCVSLGKVGGSSTEGPSAGWNRGSEGHPHRKETEKGLEEDGDQSLLRRRRIHTQTAQIWALHQTYGKTSHMYSQAGQNNQNNTLSELWQ